MQGLHPAAYLLIAIELSTAALLVPTGYGLILLFGWFLFMSLRPVRTDAHMMGSFLRLLVVAAGFLFILHAVSISPPGITLNGIRYALRLFVRIAAPVTGVLFLARNVRGDEMFALLVDWRVPPAAILIVFRTIWLIPRLRTMMENVVTAQKLRGMPVDSLSRRFQAIVPTLSTLFSAMVDEISENALVLTTRGFLVPGKKSHLTPISFTTADIIATVAVSAFSVLMCLFTLTGTLP
jgi:energy-coupling factor transporter transmembrane protein EcfT